MSKRQIRYIDLSVYLTAVILDSLGVAILMRTGFGSTPYGIFVANMAIILPLGVGIISFLYECLYVFAASRINRGKFRWTTLIYSLMFSILLELHLSWLSDYSQETWATKVLLTLLAIVVLDLSKAFFGITPFPRLSIVECLDAIHKRWGTNMGTLLQAYNAFNLVLGIMVSFIAGKPLNQLGVGSVMALVFSGMLLGKCHQPIQRLYHNKVRGQRV